jgi:putative membrane protein
MKTIHAFALTAAVAVLAALGCGKSEDPYRTSEKLDSSNPDEKFLWKAAQANFAEMEAGRLAEASAGDAEVRRFGQRMVEDHRRAQADLTDLALKKGFRVPTRADESHQKDASKLAEHSGAKFDREFMSQMVSDHKKAVSLFEDAAKDGKDPDVRDFARTMTPTLRDHQKMATDLKDRIHSAPAAK